MKQYLRITIVAMVALIIAPALASASSHSAPAQMHLFAIYLGGMVDAVFALDTNAFLRETAGMANSLWRLAIHHGGLILFASIGTAIYAWSHRHMLITRLVAPTSPYAH